MVTGTDWVDPSDPTVIAENELLTAASSIEAAAKKLSELKPRQKAKVGVQYLNHYSNSNDRCTQCMKI